jgi:DNA-binding LytR/AlgR family response regulator
MLNVAIIDDDKLYRQILRKYIDKTDTLHLSKEYDSAVSALCDAEFESVDVVILDVEMPSLSGLQFLDELKLKPMVVMTSINSNYAVQAFNYGAVDFLEKPIIYVRFLQSILRIQNLIHQKNCPMDTFNHIYLKSNNGHLRINFDEIIYIEAYSDYINFHTTKERFTALSTMKSIEERLPKSKFIRVHRSYIVHIDKINRFEDNMIKVGDKVIPVSRSCKENLMLRLNFF